MAEFIADYWGLIVAALLILLGLVWLAGGRRGRKIDDAAPDMEMERDRRIGAATEATGAASSAGAVGLNSGDGGPATATDPAIEDAPESETEANSREADAREMPASGQEAPAAAVSEPAPADAVSEPAPADGDKAAAESPDAVPAAREPNQGEARAAAPSDVSAPDIPAAVGEPDNLQLMKGVGPKLDARLRELGVTRFDQIAAWSERDIAAVDSRLGNFQGRIERDNWVEQASYLARGDRAGFEAKYGALGADPKQG